MSYRSSPFRKRACYKHTKQALNFGPFPKLFERMEAFAEPENMEQQSVFAIGVAMHHFTKMSRDERAMAYLEFCEDKSLSDTPPTSEPPETGGLRFVDYLHPKAFA